MIERKTRASRKTDRQLCTGIYRPSGTCSCQQLLASSLSFYLRMSICTPTLCKPQVSEVPHVAQFPFVHDFSRANTSEPSKHKKQTLVANFSGNLHSICLTFCEAWRYLTLVSHNNAKGVACETRWEPGKFHLHGIPGCMIDTPRACIFAVRTIKY